MAMKHGLEPGAFTLYELLKDEWVFQLPRRQRRYAWGNQQIDQVWQDIDDQRNGLYPRKILGQIVVLIRPDDQASQATPTVGKLIDGQQRLTTFYMTLVLLARHAYLAGETDLADEMRDYILNRHHHLRNRPKMKLTTHDVRQFNQLFDWMPPGKVTLDMSCDGEDQGTLSNAARRIDRHIQQRCYLGKTFQVATAAEIRDILLGRFVLTRVLVDNELDAYQYFNTLNSRGVALDTTDLVRDLVLARFDDDQEHGAEREQVFHETRWLTLEKCLGRRLNNFFFPFALAHTPTARDAQIMNTLTARWSGLDADAIMDDLMVYEDIYNALTSDEIVPRGQEIWVNLTTSLRINTWVGVLNRMGMPRSALPYAMRLVNGFRQGSLTEAHAFAGLRLLESFFVRRSLAGIEPTGLQTVFKSMANEVQDDPTRMVSIIEAKPTVVFPSDAQTVQGVCNRPFYGTHAAPFLAGEYERSVRLDDPLPLGTKLSLDHIMPQNTTPYWDAAFLDGAVTGDTYGSVVHRWGNIVPVTKVINSRKGGNDWPSVQSLFKHDSVYATPRRVADEYVAWTSNAIRERGEMLSAWAVDRWPLTQDLARLNEIPEEYRKDCGLRGRSRHKIADTNQAA